MPDYIDLPVDTDPQDILQDAYTYLQANIPGWNPASGNLDVWLLGAVAAAAAETRDVASAVPRSIFRWFGANLIGLAPVDAVPATSTVKITVQDTAGYTIPNGTQLSINSTGQVPIGFVTVGDTIIAPGVNNAPTVSIVAIIAGASGSGLGVINGVINLEDPLVFVTSVQLNAVTTGGTDAETDDAYLNRLASQLKLLAPRPILPADFAVFARNISGVNRAVAIDGYNPVHNLLTLNEASVETDVSGWISLANTTLTQTGAQFLDGIKAIQMLATTAADMSVNLQTANAKTVTPGDTITGVASFRSAVTARVVKVGLRWLDGTNTPIGAVAYGTTANDTTSGWTACTVTGVAPLTAAKVQLVLFVTAPVINEVHYVDQMSLRRGAGTDWVAGGTAETGNARMVAVACIDINGNPVSSPIKTAVNADLQARREVTFVVNVMDPVTTLIDVTYDVKILPSWDTATVIANVNSALAAYLNPGVWGTPPGSTGKDWLNQTTVRYLELAQVINEAGGVDYITTTAGNYNLTIGYHGGTLARADITLPGPAPLPNDGTVVGTAA